MSSRVIRSPAVDLAAFIRSLPKVELHVHIEGTLEPELMFGLARRNQVSVPFADVDSVRAAYRFTNLQSFLDIYYQAAALLRTEEDFYDLMSAYLRRAAADGVRHAEIFFDPQIHTGRGVPFVVFMEGFQRAITDTEADLGISAELIMCFLRHLPEAAAIATLEEARPHLHQILAVGLDSSEVGYPPEMFKEVFRRAKSMGLRAVAHAAEEGPPSYVWGALDLLGAERIDHGVRSLEDAELVARLARERVPLTVCPLSNVSLGGFDRLEDHCLKRMLDLGLVVSINSDDPAYFGGYIGEAYLATSVALGLSRVEIKTIARNSIESSFLPSDLRQALLMELEALT
jgi:adenosine deaminase